MKTIKVDKDTVINAYKRIWRNAHDLLEVSKIRFRKFRFTELEKQYREDIERSEETIKLIKEHQWYGAYRVWRGEGIMDYFEEKGVDFSTFPEIMSDYVENSRIDYFLSSEDFISPNTERIKS